MRNPIQAHPAAPPRENSDLLAGVIEGFYGQPWTQAERFELFDWMARWGLNTYLYAPKDDLKHRVLWREPYSAEEAGNLQALVRACAERNLRFIYGLSPGLDIRYGNADDLDYLRNRLQQLLELDCRHFCLLFDDIPDRLNPEDLQRCGSLASAQCQVANSLFNWVRKRCPDTRFFFCPTAYCGRMANHKIGGENYLPTIGRELLPEINVFWTGPEIVSREITVAHLSEWRRVLRRKPVIWDNLHANDYDGRRFFCGPYEGRPLALRSLTSGVLTNPNNEFPLNYVPLRTLAEFVHCQGTWDPRQAYLDAMREWLPRFETIAQPVTFEDLVLFGDCYYLPHAEGPEAEALYQAARGLLAGTSTDWRTQAVAVRQQSTRLREFCVRLTELRHRPLFYALSRRIWELREELDLLEHFLDSKASSGPPAPCHSDAHLATTYRGGLVARLQRLWVQQPDGALVPAARAERPPASDTINPPPIPAL